jgi:hypothetical protein
MAGYKALSDHLAGEKRVVGWLSLHHRKELQGKYMATVKNSDDFITAKHSRLLRIALVANVFAWIALIVNLLLVGTRFLRFQAAYAQNPIFMGEVLDFWAMLGRNPTYLANLIVDLLTNFLNGVVAWLTLKGISLGLNMIVETDLNYREKAKG